MASHILIERPDKSVTLVRSGLDTPSEDALTEHEKIISELQNQINLLSLPVDNEDVCPKCSSNDVIWTCYCNNCKECV